MPETIAGSTPSKAFPTPRFAPVTTFDRPEKLAGQHVELDLRGRR